jgi:hypothetical protein
VLTATTVGIFAGSLAATTVGWPTTMSSTDTSPWGSVISTGADRRSSATTRAVIFTPSGRPQRR